MTFLFPFLAFFAGMLLGAGALYVLAMRWIREGDMRTADLNSKLLVSEEKHRLLASQQKSEAEMESKWREIFKGIAFDAHKASNEMISKESQAAFSKLHQLSKDDLSHRQSAIGDLVKPLRESLEKVDAKIQSLEKERVGAYQSLHSEIKNLVESESKLREQTETLSKALHTPTIRGRWGEIQLRKVVEIAGMQKYCDFTEQRGDGEAAGKARPDMVIRLPGNRHVIVDAKAPITSLVAAHEARDREEQQAHLASYAVNLKKHIVALSKKEYWKSYDPSPDFVILFLPGESFFAAALAHSPELIEEGARKNVLVATPTTLIAMLRAIALGWKQENLAGNAQKISELGAILHERIIRLEGFFNKLGKSINLSVDAFNQTVGSIQSRIMPSARSLGDMCGKADTPRVKSIEGEARQIDLIGQNLEG